MTYRATPTAHEVVFGAGEVIVSKTDLAGKITYANPVFLKVSGYSEHELLGAAHSIVRHPDMPRCVFQYLWDTIGAGDEVFAYVKNMAKSGDFYWVFAHVTPTFDESGKIVAYHSNRRLPKRSAIEAIEGIYRALLAEEARQPNKAKAIEAGMALLTKTLAGAGLTYPEFVFSL